MSKLPYKPETQIQVNLDFLRIKFIATHDKI